MTKIFYPSTTDEGQDFGREMIARVWAKAHKNCHHVDLEAYDMSGRLMLWDEYRNRNSEFGWEIDHILPRERGGRTVIENLQPLNWRTNEEKSDAHPWSSSNFQRVLK
jgi:hypothetical protein